MTTPDFSELLSRPTGKALKPQVLPIADYPGVIKTFKFDKTPKEGTPLVQYTVVLTGWPDSVPEDERGQSDSDGTFHPTDISKRSCYRSFFLDETSAWKHEAFLRSCGIELGAPLGELVPQVVGKAVLVEIRQRMDETTNEMANDMYKGRLVGMEG